MVAAPPVTLRRRLPSVPDRAGAFFNAQLSRTFLRHSLGWLAAANLVGVWLAANLVWPQLGRIAAPLSYGRWMPLHTDWLLYGWCALPLVALVFFWIPAPDRRHAKIAAATVLLWSTVLATSGAGWLEGHVSGKLFLTARGPLRMGLPFAMVVLWSCLAANLWHAGPTLRSGARAARVAGLLLLLPVPLVLFWAGDPRIYPAVNPQSGGATGASLLGSTLVVLALVGLLPWALKIKPRGGAGFRRAFTVYWVLSAGVYALVDHGNVSHHDAVAIGALSTLLAWILILAGYLRSFSWDSAPHWRWALVGWWAFLAVDGLVSFLPGVSEALKFTNGLVAHAHLAMAGFASALLFVILQTLAHERWRGVLENGVAFGVWQLGNVAFVTAMLALGWRESAVAGVLFHDDAVASALYAVRLIAGTAMAAASVWWFFRSCLVRELNP